MAYNLPRFLRIQEEYLIYMEVQKFRHLHCELKRGIVFVILNGDDRLSAYTQLIRHIFLTQPRVLS